MGSVEPPRPSKLVPLAQAGSACLSWFRLPKLVPPAQLGSACRSWFHELFFANELINYFTCMTLEMKISEREVVYGAHGPQQTAADPGHFKYMPVYGSLMILCEV